MIRLLAMTDADFGWLLGEADRGDTLRLCDGGIAPAEVLAMLRGVTAGVAATTIAPVAWMIVEDDLVVGMVSFAKRGADGRYELGYGVAPAHQGRGVMTQAIAALLPIARADGHRGLTAETSIANPASQQVLRANGFVSVGERDDPEDGPLVTWTIDLVEEVAMELRA